jgi:radical SAM superfamily enzyme YgiQ (UPF0313 family)/MoaA/NifB/PqqE/SkfB family radical SAM enzyme
MYLDLKTGYVCNNNCLFCVIADLRKEGNRTTEELKKALKESRSDCDSVNFTGGEATIRPDIIELISYAKGLGYSKIQIQTNGRMLADKIFLTKLVKAGATDFGPSLHGHTAKLHDMLTNSDGSFYQTIKAIKNIKELGLHVSTNTVIVKQNYHYLPDIARLLSKLNVDQAQFSFVHILGNARLNLESTVPRLSETLPFVHKAVDTCINAKIRCTTEAIPFCMMDGREKYISECKDVKYEVSYRNYQEKNSLEIRRKKHKSKFKQCKECIYDNICEGTWKEYYDLFGDKEFKAIKKDSDILFMSKNLKLDQSFKVVLCIPPSYQNTFPPLGTPSLTAFLKSKGIYTRQYDLNIKFWDYLKANKLENVLEEEYKLNKIREKAYYSEELKVKHTNPNDNMEFKNIIGTSFYFAERMLSSKDLHKFIEDEKENIFYKFFKTEVIPILLKTNYEVIGFSILSPSQVLPTFTLTNLIRKHMPQTKIIIGGQWVSFYREQLKNRADLTRYFDYVIVSEAETPLYELISAIKKKDMTKISQIPNLIYLKDNKLLSSTRTSEEDFESLPCPDFDDLPLDKYRMSSFTGFRHLTYQTSRGCYWSRCCFCDDLPMPKPTYREKSIDKIIKEIKYLKERYNASFFMISNLTFSPTQIKKFSERIISEKLNIHWASMTRFDKTLSIDTLLNIKKSGCSYLDMGFESGCQRILDHCEKGNNLDIVERVVTDANKINLKIVLQVIIGLPSETIEDALETIKFLLVHKENETVFSIFYLIPNTKVFNNPSKYGIELTKETTVPFQYFYQYRQVKSNMTYKTAENIIQFYEYCKKNKSIPKNMLAEFNRFMKEKERMNRKKNV